MIKISSVTIRVHTLHTRQQGTYIYKCTDARAHAHTHIAFIPDTCSIFIGYPDVRNHSPVILVLCLTVIRHLIEYLVGINLVPYREIARWMVLSPVAGSVIDSIPRIFVSRGISPAARSHDLSNFPAVYRERKKKKNDSNPVLILQMVASSTSIILIRFQRIFKNNLSFRKIKPRVIFFIILIILEIRFDSKTIIRFEKSEKKKLNQYRSSSSCQK